MSLKTRILEALAKSAVVFVVLCAVHKFIYNDANWLFSATLWSICWCTGDLASIYIVFLNESFWKTLSLNAMTSLVAIVITIFVLRVVLSIQNWFSNAFNIIVSFVGSLFINTLRELKNQ